MEKNYSKIFYEFEGKFKNSKYVPILYYISTILYHLTISFVFMKAYNLYIASLGLFKINLFHSFGILLVINFIIGSNKFTYTLYKSIFDSKYFEIVSSKIFKIMECALGIFVYMMFYIIFIILKFLAF